MSAELIEQAQELPHVLNLSVMVGSGFAVSLAEALLAHLPAEPVRPLVQQVITKVWADAMELVDEDPEPPMGLTTWGDHSWFHESLRGDADWAEVQGERTAGRRKA